MFYVTGYADKRASVPKKSPRQLTADVFRYLFSAVTDAVQKLTVLGHHNKQILLHKITSKAKWKEQIRS